MAGEFLLDTNIVSAILDSDPTLIGDPTTLGVLRVPSIVIGELYFGAENSGRPVPNAQRIAAYAASVIVIPCDAETGQVYGGVKLKLRKKGKPIPENDIWIASVAIQHQLTLVTRDAHFDQVEGLSVVRW